ncbi:MAG: hypothetical protein DWQ36_00990 [Acidobacteria bacterium]|nr:MAG: hypothetical protein DWQ36_00990 [Acidobacteriota bacterium]
MRRAVLEQAAEAELEIVPAQVLEGARLHPATAQLGAHALQAAAQPSVEAAVADAGLARQGADLLAVAVVAPQQPTHRRIELAEDLAQVALELALDLLAPRIDQPALDPAGRLDVAGLALRHETAARAHRQLGDHLAQLAGVGAGRLGDDRHRVVDRVAVAPDQPLETHRRDAELAGPLRGLPLAPDQDAVVAHQTQHHRAQEEATRRLAAELAQPQVVVVDQPDQHPGEAVVGLVGEPWAAGHLDDLTDLVEVVDQQLPRGGDLGRGLKVGRGGGCGGGAQRAAPGLAAA